MFAALNRWSRGARALSRAELIELYSELSDLFESQKAPAEVFEMALEDQDNKRIIKVIERIKKELESGRTLGHCIATELERGDEFIVNVIDMGVQQGVVASVFRHLSERVERRRLVRRLLMRVIWWPIGYLLAAFIFISIFAIFIIPSFAAMFSSFGADLPAFTKAVIGVADYAWVVQVILFAAVAVYVLRRYFPRFRIASDRLLLRIPGWGNILKRLGFDQYLGVLQMLLAGGVAEKEAVRRASEAIGNQAIKIDLQQVARRVDQGELFSNALRQSRLVPRRMVRLVALGESTDSVTAKLTDYYQRHGEGLTQLMYGFSGRVDFVLKISVMAILGALIIALYLPIFKMGSVL